MLQTLDARSDRLTGGIEFADRLLRSRPQLVDRPASLVAVQRSDIFANLTRAERHPCNHGLEAGRANCFVCNISKPSFVLIDRFAKLGNRPLIGHAAVQ